MGYRDHRFFYDLILTFEIDGIKGKRYRKFQFKM